MLLVGVHSCHAACCQSMRTAPLPCPPLALHCLGQPAHLPRGVTSCTPHSPHSQPPQAQPVRRDPHAQRLGTGRVGGGALAPRCARPAAAARLHHRAGAAQLGLPVRGACSCRLVQPARQSQAARQAEAVLCTRCTTGGKNVCWLRATGPPHCAAGAVAAPQQVQSMECRSVGNAER